MNRGMSVMAAVALAAMSLTACSDSTNPVGSQSSLEFGSGQPMARILQALEAPRLDVSVFGGGSYELTFSAGASGQADAPSMIAARSIQLVEFEIYDATGSLIGSARTTEVPTTGVQNGANDVGSITVFAEGRVAPTVPVGPGAYAIARVHGGGDMLETSTEVPVLRND